MQRIVVSRKLNDLCSLLLFLSLSFTGVTLSQSTIFACTRTHTHKHVPFIYSCAHSVLTCTYVVIRQPLERLSDQGSVFPSLFTLCLHNPAITNLFLVEQHKNLLSNHQMTHSIIKKHSQNSGLSLACDAF